MVHGSSSSGRQQAAPGKAMPGEGGDAWQRAKGVFNLGTLARHINCRCSFAARRRVKANPLLPLHTQRVYNKENHVASNAATKMFRVHPRA